MKPGPQRCQHPHRLLLPWYANGTLCEEERRQVERHLERCASCRQELELDNALHAFGGESEGATVAIHPRRLDALMERIDNGTPRFARLRSWWEQRRASQFRQRDLAAGIAWSLVLIEMVALVLLLIPVWRDGGVAAPYRTLFSPVASHGPAASGQVIRLVFSDTLTLGELFDLVESLHGELVGGSVATHVLHVRLPISPAETRQRLRELRADPRIVFAEPLAGPPR